MEEPKTYRVKPENVRAWRWTVDFTAGFETAIEDLWECGEKIAKWCGGNLIRDEIFGNEWNTQSWVLYVQTPEGGRRLLPGDYVYKDENGEFWVKQAGQFEHRFEEDE